MDYRCVLVGATSAEPLLLLRLLRQHAASSSSNSNNDKSSADTAHVTTLSSLSPLQQEALLLHAPVQLLLPNPSMPSVNVRVTFTVVTSALQLTRLFGVPDVPATASPRARRLQRSRRRQQTQQQQQQHSSCVDSSCDALSFVCYAHVPHAIVLVYNALRHDSFDTLRYVWVRQLARCRAYYTCHGSNANDDVATTHPQQRSRLHTTGSHAAAAAAMPSASSPAAMTTATTPPLLPTFPATLLVAVAPHTRLLRGLTATPVTQLPHTIDVAEVAAAAMSCAYMEITEAWPDRVGELRAWVARACVGELDGAQGVVASVVEAVRDETVMRLVCCALADDKGSSKDDEAQSSTDTDGDGDDSEVKDRTMCVVPTAAAADDAIAVTTPSHTAAVPLSLHVQNDDSAAAATAADEHDRVAATARARTTAAVTTALHDGDDDDDALRALVHDALARRRRSVRRWRRQWRRDVADVCAALASTVQQDEGATTAATTSVAAPPRHRRVVMTRAHDADNIDADEGDAVHMHSCHTHNNDCHDDTTTALVTASRAMHAATRRVRGLLLARTAQLQQQEQHLLLRLSPRPTQQSQAAEEHDVQAAADDDDARGTAHTTAVRALCALTQYDGHADALAQCAVSLSDVRGTSTSSATRTRCTAAATSLLSPPYATAAAAAHCGTVDVDDDDTHVVQLLLDGAHCLHRLAQRGAHAAAATTAADATATLSAALHTHVSLVLQRYEQHARSDGSGDNTEASAAAAHEKGDIVDWRVWLTRRVSTYVTNTSDATQQQQQQQRMWRALHDAAVCSSSSKTNEADEHDDDNIVDALPPSFCAELRTFASRCLA